MVPDEFDSDDAGELAIVEKRPNLDEPTRYAVILHNDDYTTMEFVIEVLQKYFHKSTADAHEIMMSVHKAGKGIAGIYSFEIAETKVAQVMQYARGNGHPLKCTMEQT